MKVFVVVGTQKFQFNRLLKEVDLLVQEDLLLPQEVYAQIGSSTYTPKHYEYQNFLDKSSFEAEIRKCDILITHSGVGTIISGLRNKKKVVVCPRLREYGEHIDNHQVEIAKAYSDNGFVIPCFCLDNLYGRIIQAKGFKSKEYISSRIHINEMIDQFLIQNVLGGEKE